MYLFAISSKMVVTLSFFLSPPLLDPTIYLKLLGNTCMHLTSAPSTIFIGTSFPSAFSSFLITFQQMLFITSRAPWCDLRSQIWPKIEIMACHALIATILRSESNSFLEITVLMDCKNTLMVLLNTCSSIWHIFGSKILEIRRKPTHCFLGSESQIRAFIEFTNVSSISKIWF